MGGASAAGKPLSAETATIYRTASGTAQECLGRLVFDVSEPIDWPTFYNSKESHGNSSAFTASVRANGGEMVVGATKVTVYGPLNAQLSGWLKDQQPGRRIARQRTLVKKVADEIEGLLRVQSPTSKIKNEIMLLKRDMASREASIRELETQFTPFVPGLEDSEGFHETTTFGANDSVAYSVYHASLVRGKYVYLFESTQELGPLLNQEQHKQKFVTFLQKFRPRKLNEIPTDPGVCIPYGFIADDGKTKTDINQSFRWSDAPGVLYSIHTGTAGERKDKTPAITALVTAATGRLGTSEESNIKPFITERIGPRTYLIGNLKASQGGVALKVTEAGKIPYETYNVFTGYSGIWGSEVLPFILIEMSTRTMEQAPELPQNPPPFKQSMVRLETLLKSTRLRSTHPPMPERAKLIK